MDAVKNWGGQNFHYYSQQGDDLGRRMENAFSLVFELGFDQVIIIGTDLPDIKAQVIDEAFDKFNSSDVVIGPSNDGGYYLLGMKSLHKELFSEIEWSSGSVFIRTISELEKSKVSYSLLDEMVDIDTAEDLNSWVSSASQNSPALILDFVKKNLSI